MILLDLMKGLIKNLDSYRIFSGKPFLINYLKFSTHTADLSFCYHSYSKEYKFGKESMWFKFERYDFYINESNDYILYSHLLPGFGIRDNVFNIEDIRSNDLDINILIYGKVLLKEMN